MLNLRICTNTHLTLQLIKTGKYDQTIITEKIRARKRKERDLMYVPPFVCGVVATILVEIILLVLWAVACKAENIIDSEEDDEIV